MKNGPSTVRPFRICAAFAGRPARRFNQHLLVVAIELPDREAAATREPAGRRRAIHRTSHWLAEKPPRLLAACVARRRSCGHWASTLPSAGKAGPEAGSIKIRAT